MKVVWSHTITTQCPYKTSIANQFPQLISRIGRSKIPIGKSKFHKNFQPKHQKGRRVPINLQDRVISEIKRLLEIYFSYSYQIPNFETLMDSISQIITNYKTEPAGKIYFSTIELRCAYCQPNLHPETAVSGDMTSTYRFKTGFYGLKDMPAEFQKARDSRLIGLRLIGPILG